MRLSFLGLLVFTAPYLPWVLMGFSLVLHGTVAQMLYVGQGYRYRVRLPDAEVWVHAPERIDEGTAATIAVPHEALLLFPLQ